MERLDFALPELTRLSWVSDSARVAWEPRLGRITRAWLDIEWLAVLSDVRRCAVTLVTAEDLVPKSGEWLKHGLSMLPPEVEGTSGHSYANASRQPRVGE